VGDDLHVKLPHADGGELSRVVERLLRSRSVVEIFSVGKEEVFAHVAEGEDGL
jgi:hypothetical protein